MVPENAEVGEALRPGADREGEKPAGGRGRKSGPQGYPVEELAGLLQGCGAGEALEERHHPGSRRIAASLMVEEAKPVEVLDMGLADDSECRCVSRILHENREPRLAQVIAQAEKPVGKPVGGEFSGDCAAFRGLEDVEPRQKRAFPPDIRQRGRARYGGHSRERREKGSGTHASKGMRTCFEYPGGNAGEVVERRTAIGPDKVKRLPDRRDKTCCAKHLERGLVAGSEYLVEKTLNGLRARHGQESGQPCERALVGAWQRSVERDRQRGATGILDGHEVVATGMPKQYLRGGRCGGKAVVELDFDHSRLGIVARPGARRERPANRRPGEPGLAFDRPSVRRFDHEPKGILGLPRNETQGGYCSRPLDGDP